MILVDNNAQVSANFSNCTASECVNCQCPDCVDGDCVDN
jgi:hypothetical protein